MADEIELAHRVSELNPRSLLKLVSAVHTAFVKHAKKNHWFGLEGRVKEQALFRKQMRVGDHLAAAPCAAVDQSLGQAADIMREQGVKLLPVLELGRPVGLLSEREMSLAELLLPAGWEELPITAVMSGIPYCVPPEAPVAEVAQHLAVRRLEAAVVMVGSRIVGLFSVADALMLLACVVGVEAAEEESEEPIQMSLSPPTGHCGGIR